MSNYDKETKFYWLQLKEDFFEDDAIQWLEEQKPNGRDYAYFYLKLCLKSLKTNGILIRKVGEILIPYDNQKLAELTRMDFDTVTVAMELLKQIGLVKILDCGEIYIQQIENLIGKKSIGALKKQQQRFFGGQKADKCPPKIELELELKKELEKEKDTDTEKNQKIIKCYEENIGTMTPASAELLFTYLEDFKEDMIIEAIKMASIQNKKSTKYICGILNSWKNKGFKTLIDIENEKTNKNAKNDKNCTHNFENELAQYGDLSTVYDN